MPAGAEAGQAADRCWGCRGWARSGQGPDEMPAGRNRVAAGRDGSGQMLAGAEAGTGQDADDQITGAGGGTSRDRGRRQPNQLKRKRSIISSSNSGFSKSFSLVMIKLLCSQNPASW